MAIPLPALTALTEVLDDTREAHPRWVVIDAANAGQADALSREAAAAGEARGFVPVDVASYTRRRRADEAIAGRTLLLIGRFAKSVGQARTALLDAAADSPRPHVLLTFQAAETGTSGIVREARAVYGALAGNVATTTTPVSFEIRKQLDRASRWMEFQRRGRHAAAERLLRDVASALIRRSAHAHAAQMLIALGRLVMERGRATAAEKVFAEAAAAAMDGGNDALGVDARIWQALARTDAGRFTEAESLCRAVLLTRPLAASHDLWARAALARVLCAQRRLDEARQLSLPKRHVSVEDLDPLVAASVEATIVRLLVQTGDLFRAGLRARTLLRGVAGADPLVGLIAATAHLRVLAEAGDLQLAEECWQHIASLARQTRSPFRALRARLVWHAALERAGRVHDAHRELTAMTRIQQVAPPALRRAIEERASQSSRREPLAPLEPSEPREPPESSPSSTLAVELISIAQEDEDEAIVVRRILSRAASELVSARLDLVSADAGPLSSILTVGSGSVPLAAARALETGITIDSAERNGYEVAVPVRSAGRLIAALAARWPVDRRPGTGAAQTLAITAAIAAPRVETFLSRARDLSHASIRIPELVGISAAMNDLRHAIERAARAPFAVLIEGESGVGKELAARAIHHLGPRRERPFCDINCAALPDELLESELFGHAKGAFTGAVSDKAGLFEQADGGTLFLDEVADLSPRAQAKLLRVLQQQEVRRVGETFTRKIDVRVVAAANRDLRVEAAAGRFRADLLFRLDVIHLRIPPLRDRPEDIPLLARHCWESAAARVASQATLTHGVLAALARHAWPGNVRELQNVISALAVAAPARGAVRASLLPAAITASAGRAGGPLADARLAFERAFVSSALARAGGSRTRAASELGLSRQGLLKTMARLGLERPAEAESMDATGCS